MIFIFWAQSPFRLKLFTITEHKGNCVAVKLTRVVSEWMHQWHVCWWANPLPLAEQAGWIPWQETAKSWDALKFVQDIGVSQNGYPKNIAISKKIEKIKEQSDSSDDSNYGITKRYPLVNEHSYGKLPSLRGESSISGPFSKARCNKLPTNTQFLLKIIENAMFHSYNIYIYICIYIYLCIYIYVSLTQELSLPVSVSNMSFW